MLWNVGLRIDEISVSGDVETQWLAATVSATIGATTLLPHASARWISMATPTFRDGLGKRIADKLTRIVRRTPPGLAMFRLMHRSEPRYECPVCGYVGPFAGVRSVYGHRPHATCPDCGSGERHRLLSLVMDQLRSERRFADMSMLHFAPEPFFRRRFEHEFREYLTADLVIRRVDLRADLTRLPFPSGSQDIVFASFILQYIREDMDALREIRRVLRPGGIALLPVPIVGAKTVEYPEPNQLESGGHIRAPGRDYYDRFATVFPRMELKSSADYPERFQLHVDEDRTGWPTPQMPLRTPSPGDRHPEIVPVCRA